MVFTAEQTVELQNEMDIEPGIEHLLAHLNHQMELMVTIFSAATDAIFVIDPVGTILSANGVALDMFGYTSLEGNRIEDLLHLYDDALTVLRGQHELRGFGVRRDGSEFLIHVTYNPRRADSPYETVVVRSFNQRSAAQTQLLDTYEPPQRMQMLDKFIHSIAHELKSPLTIIETSAHLLAKHSDPDRRAAYREHIHNAVARMVGLVDALQIRSRLETDEALNLEDIDLMDAVLEAAASCRTRLTLVRDDCPPPIRADSDLLQRALNTVVSLLADLNGSDGVLDIRINAALSGTRVDLAIPDSAGIELAWFTDPSARVENIGINPIELSLANEIIRAHGGTLTLEHIDSHDFVVIEFRA